VAVESYEPVRFSLAQPRPTAVHAAFLASQHLLLEHAESWAAVEVRPSSGVTTFFESWEVTRAALMARMASTLRHLSYLAASTSRLDGIALARTLVDHVITFAWLSGDPSTRLPAFLRTSFKSQLAKDRRARDAGSQVLDDHMRERLSAFTREVSVEMPRLPRLSREANESWRARAETALPESLQIIDFERLYSDIYDHYAEYDHPSTLGLQFFVHLTPDRIRVDGRPERHLTEDMRPYWIAVFALAEALVVAHLSTGRPRLHKLDETLELIGTIRELERIGDLSIDESGDGFSLDVQSAKPT
jgi:hypothetical protein